MTHQVVRALMALSDVTLDMDRNLEQKHIDLCHDLADESFKRLEEIA